MNRIFLSFLWLLMIFNGCNSAEETDPTVTSITHKIGSTKVRTTLHTFSGSKLLYFNMHDDENTAVEAALNVLRKTGGQLLQLEHTGERLIRFELQGEEFVVDPNRIFTEEGIRASLERYSRLDQDAFLAVKSFAEEILRGYNLMDQPVIVTLHNNQQEGYSALSYTEGGSYEEEAVGVYLSQAHDPDDFFFVTTERLFDLFQESGWNVVLQDNHHATDDGSLSVLAGQKALPYINIEAQHGHLPTQESMILEVHKHFSGSVD